MAIDAETLRRQLKSFTDSGNVTMLGEVADIDKTERTCTLQVNGANYYNVRLQCITGNESGVCAYPKTGAMALALQVSGSDGWMIVQTAEVETIEISVGKSKIEVKDGEIALNDGETGMAKTKELTEKLNKLEQRCNDIVSTLQGITIALAPSGSFPLASYFTSLSPMAQTQQSEIEDTTIKH